MQAARQAQVLEHARCVLSAYHISQLVPFVARSGPLCTCGTGAHAVERLVSVWLARTAASMARPPCLRARGRGGAGVLRTSRPLAKPVLLEPHLQLDRVDGKLRGQVHVVNILLHQRDHRLRVGSGRGLGSTEQAGAQGAFPTEAPERGLTAANLPSAASAELRQHSLRACRGASGRQTPRSRC